MWACEGGHLSTVEALLESGASVKACNRWGLTPLMRAADAGHTAVVEKLVGAGALVDAKAKAHVPYEKIRVELPALCKGTGVDANKLEAFIVCCAADCCCRHCCGCGCRRRPPAADVAAVPPPAAEAPTTQ